MQANEGFHSILTVCYNRTTVRTLYSINILYSVIEGAETRNQRPPWIKGHPSLYPENFDIHETYKYVSSYLLKMDNCFTFNTTATCNTVCFLIVKNRVHNFCSHCFI